jgi:pimeloyl-ACP methyl ester carboxylesterase
MVAFPALVGGCAAPRINAASRTHVGQVFCLRGLFDVFSLGLDDLAERLRREGVNATAVSGPSWRTLGGEICRARSRGDLQGPLILIGHSYGADNAIRLARYLVHQNIEVELLVLLDATDPPAVPENVVRCLHVYRPTALGDLLPSVFAGNPVQAEGGNNRTEIANEIVSPEIFGTAAAHIGHLNLDASAAVHELIVDEVLRICPTHGVSEGDLSESRDDPASHRSREER